MLCSASKQQILSHNMEAKNAVATNHNDHGSCKNADPQ